MFTWLKKLIKAVLKLIKSVIKKIADVLGPILPLLIIAAFVFAPALSAYFMAEYPLLASVFGAMSVGGFWTQLAIGIGASFLIVPTETAALLEKSVEAVGDVLTKAAEVAGDVIGTGVDSLFGSSGLLLVAAAVGIYLIATSDSGKEVHYVQQQEGVATA